MARRNSSRQSQQRGAHADAGAQDLAGGGHAPFAQGVVVAELPAVEAAFFAEHVDAAFHGEGHLVDAEAAHGAAGQVVGIDGLGVDVRGRDMVGAAGVAGGPFQDLGPHRSIGAGVAGDPGPQRRQLPLSVAAQGVFHHEGVALGMHADRLGPAQTHPHRLLQQQGEQGGMALDGHVLLAAEAAAVGHLDDPHFFLGQAQQRGHLAPVLVHPLPLRIEAHAAFFGQGDRRLGFQKSVLDHLGAEHAGSDVSRSGKDLVDIAAALDAAGLQQVALFMDADGAVFRLQNIGQRFQDFIFHFDGADRGAGGGFARGHHPGQDIGAAAAGLAGGNHQRPVGDDQPGQALARYVGGGKYPQDPGHFCSFPGVDLQDFGPGMVAEFQGAVDHAGDAQVGDKGPAAGRGLPGLVFFLAAADALVRINRGGFSPGQNLGRRARWLRQF